MAKLRSRMSEQELKERQAQRVQEMVKTGDQLVDKWSNSKSLLGEDVVGSKKGASRLISVYESNPQKARNWAQLMENTSKDMQQRITEMQYSSSVTGVTPNNVLKVISYAYPNSVRGDIFHEWAMETTKDSMYFLTGQYDKTKRGVNSGDSIISTTNDGRAVGEVEQQSATEVTDGFEVTFTASLSVTPVVEKKVLVFMTGIPVGYDDGAGNIIPLTTDQTTGNVDSGTIDYTTGAISVTFDTAPLSTDTVVFQYSFDSEIEGNWDETMTVKLALQEYRFEPRPHNVNLEWAQMLSWKMGSTLDVNVEQQFIKMAGDALLTNTDNYALNLGYQFAKSFGAPIPYEASYGAKNATDPAGYADTFTRALKKVEKEMYGSYNRGSASILYAKSDVVGFLSQSRKWQENTSAIKIGPYLAGTYDGIPVFQAEGVTDMGDDEVVAIYKNKTSPEDAFMSFGVYLPMVMTPKMQFKNFNNELGVTSVYAHEKINNYARLIKLNNLDID